MCPQGQRLKPHGHGPWMPAAMGTWRTPRVSAGRLALPVSGSDVGPGVRDSLHKTLRGLGRSGQAASCPQNNTVSLVSPEAPGPNWHQRNALQA